MNSFFTVKIYLARESCIPTAIVSPPQCQTNLPSTQHSLYSSKCNFSTNEISTVALEPPMIIFSLAAFTAHQSTIAFTACPLDNFNQFQDSSWNINTVHMKQQFVQPE